MKWVYARDIWAMLPQHASWILKKLLEASKTTSDAEVDSLQVLNSTTFSIKHSLLNKCIKPSEMTSRKCLGEDLFATKLVVQSGI